jgi:hypothetical protein
VGFPRRRSALFANQFLVQADLAQGQPALPDLFVLTFGRVLAPPVLGTDDQKRDQLDQIDHVDVVPIARFSLTWARVIELHKLLGQTIETLTAQAAALQAEQTGAEEAAP